MKQILWYIVYFIVAFVAQTVIVPLIRIHGIGPDFVLFFTVFLALRYGGVVGAFWGFLAGYTEDVYSDVSLMGVAAMSKCLVGYAVGQLEEKFLNLGLVTKVAVLGVAFFVSDALYAVLSGVDKQHVGQMFLTKSLPEGIYTLTLGTLAFHFLYSHGSRRIS